MLILDIRTLSLVTTIFSFLFFVGLQSFARHNDRFSSIKIFAYADLLLFLGFLLLGLREMIPEFLSVILANFLIALAFFLFYYGSTAFLKAYIRHLWLHCSLLGLLLISFVYFTMVNSNINARIIILNTFLLFESLSVAILYHRHSSIQFGIQKYSVTWGFILYGAYAAFRIVWIATKNPSGNFLHGGVIHGLGFLFIQVLIINTAFSLYWIVNAILNYDLETLGNLDPLTKVLNRRAFIDALEKEIARSKRESITFSLIMGDLDTFNQINDNFGHLAGDSVLISFSNIVIDNLRINDVLSRYGGEEFMILLPNTEKKYAVETAERIRKVIEMNNHPFNGKDLKYTVSFGVTSFDMDAQNKDELLENVDMALSEAKSNGRNRVEVK